ncbi:MAG: ribonuclease E/G [Pseudomonadota bacterium]
MAKKMLIDATHAEETRVVVADGNKVDEFDFESLNKRQLAGNIYLAKVTRVEPSLQAAFVDYGGNRHGFLAFSEIHPDYYQIPVADREALLAEERAYAEAQAQEEAEAESKPKRRRRRRKTETKAEDAAGDAVATGDVPSGMDVVDLEPADGEEGGDLVTDDAPAAHADADTSDEPAETVPVEATGDAEQPAEASPSEADTEHTEPTDTAATTAKETDAATADAAPDDAAAAAASDEEDEDSDAVDEPDTVADDDAQDDIRPARKPRPRRYKIQEVVKVRQILLVQVVKEERGNKGAALTTYLSLAGRYCVLMPNTARGGGISRKITNASDRKKLKDIAQGLDVPQGAGLIIRTAGSQRTKTEIKRDYEYLQRQWEQIRALTLQSIAPAPIYEEGNLIHRSIRDLYNKEIDEVLVEGEAGYRQAKDFMKMIMPSHAKNVKHYADGMPLFARHQVEGYLADMFNPVVQLKSGGYIVIGVTEALVAIDVNSGKATKEGSIEETATKTNLEAADEVARQLRLRDLAGLIVIDFIDMDERRNNNAVEKRLKDKLKNDRARIQVGRISAFGLLEMSRQRLRPGMLEATTQACAHCHGTGLVRSDDSLALSILRQLEEEGTRRRSREVLLTAPVGIVNFILNNKREYLAELEARYGLSIRIEADVSLVVPDYRIEKFKTATRRVPAAAPILSMDTALMDEIEEAEETEVIETAEAEDGEGGEGNGKKRRRRRRGGRGRKKAGSDGQETGADAADASASEAGDGAVAEQAATASEEDAAPTAETVSEGADDADKPKRRRSRGGRGRKKSSDAENTADETSSDASSEAQPETSETAATADADAQTAGGAAPAKKPRRRRKKAEPTETADNATAPVPEPVSADPEPAPEPKPEPEPEPETARVAASAEPDPVLETKSQAAAPATDTVLAEEEPAKPKRRGWWSLGS